MPNEALTEAAACELDDLAGVAEEDAGLMLELPTETGDCTIGEDAELPTFCDEVNEELCEGAWPETPTEAERPTETPIGLAEADGAGTTFWPPVGGAVRNVASLETAEETWLTAELTKLETEETSALT